MKCAGHDKIISDPSMKDKYNKDVDKRAKKASMKSKATKALGCRKSGSSQKRAKQRCKTTGGTLELEQCVETKSLSSSPNQVIMEASDNNNGYCLHLPSTPLLHPKSPVMASSTKKPQLKFMTPVQSHLQIQKFQLQLFPLDESTRKSLEEENHCPYLELTITTKKKIASVIKHLNKKWGNSRSALEELVLFPYNARVESLESYERWSLKDSPITAAEVYDAIGKPAVFRLRYGWLNPSDPKIKNFSLASCNVANQSSSKEVPITEAANQKNQPSSGTSHECEQFPAEIFPKQSVSETYPMKSIEPEVNLRSVNDSKLSWVDGVSNMSFGALFSEAANDDAKVYRQVPHHLIPVSGDSFDAAIAAHIARFQPGSKSSAMAQPSILDAEETCNPFSFHSSTSTNIQPQSVNASSPEPRVKLYTSLNPLLELPQDDGCVPPNTTLSFEDGARPIEEVDAQLAVDLQGHKQAEKEEMQVVTNGTNTANSQFGGFDMHWPSSVDPWQFVVSPQQMINSDSNGLNGLLTTNMDIF